MNEDVAIHLLNPTDITVAVLLLLGLLGGARRGLSGELTRLATIAVAVFTAWKTFDAGAVRLADQSGWDVADLRFPAFIAIAGMIYVILGILRHSLRLFVDFSFQGKIELLGGAMIGLLRSMVVCIGLLLAATLIPSEPVRDALNASYCGRAAMDHIQPLYEQWAEENPDLKLPALDEVKDVEVPALPWDDYLGPLIEDAGDNGER